MLELFDIYSCLPLTHRSQPLQWFFLSLIITPLIAFLLLIAAGAPKASLKKCRKCAEEVKAEAQVCRFCGHSFAEDALPAIPDPGLPVSRGKDTEVRDLAAGYINRMSKKP